MAQTKPSENMDIKDAALENTQKYIDIGSNMFLGTNDGKKYTIINTPDSKIKLVEVLDNLSADVITDQGSSGSVIQILDLNDSAKAIVSQHSGKNIIKLISVKSESSSCKGQGDNLENSLFSSSQSISERKLDNSLDQDLSPKNLINLDNSGHPIYTTLLPRHEPNISEINDSKAHASFETSSPVFSTPMFVRSSSYMRKPKMPIIPRGVSYSPIPKARLRGSSRGRRPRRMTYQYNPQFLNTSTVNVSRLNLVSSDSSMCSASTSTGTFSSDSKSQLSIEYPRVPNNTPTSPEVLVSGKRTFSADWIPQIEEEVQTFMGVDPKEMHNEKERKRRRRIKNACDYMRLLLPNVTEKTDNATVFERAAKYIRFVRDTIGKEHDLEFINENYVL